MAERPPTYHWLRLRAVAHPTEDPAKVQAALRFASGLDADAFVKATQAKPMETHHGLALTVFEVVVDRSRPLRDILARVFALPDAVATLRRTLDARVDDDGILYLRLEKQAAFLETLRLGDGEDAIQVRLKVEAYPAGRKAALAALERILDAGKP